MTRSLKLTLKFANPGKQKQLDDLWSAYKQTVKGFLDCLFAGQGLSEDYLKSYESPLSYRYKQCAKRQAFKIFKTWCRNKNKRKSKPQLRVPAMTLDYRFIDVQPSENSSFDYWIKIATLFKGKPILIPVKSYNYLNQYLTDWQLLNGGKLIKQNGQWVLILSFKKSTPELKQSGKTVGLDIGYRKLGVTSEGQVIGQNLRELINKADRKQQGSKGYDKAKLEIKNYINREIKMVFNDDLQCLVVEDLKNLKQDKHGVWSKTVNRKFNFWLYGHTLSRVTQLSEISGVLNPKINPRNTSRGCAKCHFISELNRKGEYFKCLQCGHEDDADHNASLNILSRFTQANIAPVSSKPFL